MSVEYEFKLWWTEDEGWKASFGKFRMWWDKRHFITAEIDENDKFHNHHEHFYLQDALDYMRTGK